VISFLARPIVQDNIETAVRGDHELLQLLVCVPASRLSAWDVVEVVDPFDFKRYVPVFFDKGEVASSVFNSWKLN
jgi:hypothetical protein